MKKYILSICSFFITTSIIANHMYHTEGVVKHPNGKISQKIPIYASPISNEPTGDIYIRTGNIDGHTIGTLTRTRRKRKRDGTFTITTKKYSVIEDDTSNPLAKKAVSGTGKDIIGFIRNPKYSLHNQKTTPKNIPLYEYTGSSTQAAPKEAQKEAQKIHTFKKIKINIPNQTQTTNKK